MKRYVHILATAFVVMLVLTSASLVGVTMASPAVGVQPTLLARGAYEDFKVKSVKGSPVEFDVKAKSVVDVVVRKHDYAVGSHTGWHSHPGPVFITVTEGTLTYYLYDDLHAARRHQGQRIRRRRAWAHGAQRVRRVRTGHERDHRAALAPRAAQQLPRRARRSESELWLLTSTRWRGEGFR